MTRGHQTEGEGADVRTAVIAAVTTTRMQKAMTRITSQVQSLWPQMLTKMSYSSLQMAVRGSTPTTAICGSVPRYHGTGGVSRGALVVPHGGSDVACAGGMDYLCKARVGGGGADRCT
jgi:hypothetical protein